MKLGILLTSADPLDKLLIADGAEFDSYADQHEYFCLPGTRVELLSQISEWAESSNGKCIFWLNGMAGTGKSTIARTVAESFKNKDQLGATFFFKRGEANRSNARYLIPTITKQLVTKHQRLIPAVSKVIEDNPNISSKSLSEQFDKLLLQPLVRLNMNQPATIVVVIDALDECDREDDIQVILRLLPRLQNVQSVCLRIFLTSRPELPIRLSFKQNSNHQDLVLHGLPQPVIEHDIHLFLEHKLSEIRDEHLLPPEWPGNKNMEKLVKMAVPLFIFAATICRFVGDRDWLPEERLTAVLQDEAATSTSDIERTYLPVLNQLIVSRNKRDCEQFMEEFQNIVGVIILLATPLSVIALARLTGIPQRTISNRLNRFHSVLNIPDEPHQPVRILHLSFRDFLISTTSTFHVDEKETHRKIVLHCFRVMGTGLKQNICSLSSYGIERADIKSQTVNQHLSTDLQYSCQYWVYHLQQSRGYVSEFPILPFLKTHLLHWFEVLSLMGILSEAVGNIDMLQAVVAKNTNTEISEFLYDARRFILKNMFMTSIAPLQLYHSGLVFSPKQSVVRKMYSDNIPKWICPLPQVEATWSSNLQTLTGHSESVNSVAFSSDGLTLASGSSDQTIKLWNVKTGQELQTLTGHSGWVRSVAFSSDGSTLASGSYDQTIKLWDVKTGQELQTLTGHSDLINSVAFSSDGSTLASGSYDKTIKLWDMKTGQELQTLTGHSESVNSVAFSFDGSTLASGSHDRTIKLWNVKTGQELQTLTGHSDLINSVAFSFDGSTLASGSHYGTIKLWDVKTGQELQTLTGHSESVNSVTFSSDGSTLASGSHDRTIKLWNVKTGQELQTLTGHSDLINSVAFSSDGLTLASGSDDRTIKLWDVKTGQEPQTLTGHSGWVNSVVFSSDGSTLASGSDDQTIKLWDVKTGQELQTLTGHSESVNSVAFSSDGLTLASGSSDQTVKLWNVKTGQELQTLTGHLSWVRSVAFSSDGSTLASGSDDQTIKLWDVKTGQELQTLTGHSDLINSVAFSSDGSTLASGSIDKTIILWDVKTGQELQTLTGHLGWVRSVAFSSDGSTLASGSSDKTIKLWNVKTGQELQTLTGHSDSERSVAFSSEDYLIPILHMNSNPNLSHLDHQLSLSNNWVSMAGEKLMYLPPEYRLYICLAVKGVTIALGYSDGRVIAMGFHIQ
ncbi:WD-repeat protein, putative [Talaromyces stipitatus ATCC 10500]|uniref:WD-repeat protein, putative n=1 Tax=Talaromyces stipitatus (strain ATCC 10500 / CBS 375.48 / QM 6759 / NRRL 1006) TaxID=441959 RepID=B8MPQ7_TALSN|nr:WD-repeat protein, putative [Talaromyces stipitatus ATCC 10500]EED12693.1 WD-repeat protein, putative [Talaromyces stipitatus ATCC 10500]